jgi:aminopeptidase N
LTLWARFQLTLDQFTLCALFQFTLDQFTLLARCQFTLDQLTLWAFQLTLDGAQFTLKAATADRAATATASLIFRHTRLDINPSCL